MPRPIPSRLRFWPKVALPDENGCLIWLGARQISGYGRFYDGTRVTGAHRYAYELAYGPIPDGLEIDHLCGVRDCVAPAHLDAVDHLTNVRRSSVGDAQRARHAARTACKRGHIFTPETTRINGAGARVCRPCSSAYQRSYGLARRARRRDS